MIKTALEHYGVPPGWTLYERHFEDTGYSDFTASHATFTGWNDHGHKASTRLHSKPTAAVTAAKALHAEHHQALNDALQSMPKQQEPETTSEETTALAPFDADDVAVTHQAFDAEEDAWIDITGDMRRRARMLRQAWAFSKHIQAAIVREAFDRKLYLAEGCQTKKEYCEVVLGITKQSGHQLYRTATTFGLTIDGLLAQGQRLQLGDGSKTGFTPDAEDPATDDNPFAEVAISKLYELERLDEEELAHLKETKELTDAEGNTYTLDDLNRLSKRQLQKLIREKLTPVKVKLEVEEERRQKAEAERDHLRRQLEEQETRIANASKLERLYGHPASLREHKMELLAGCEAALDQLYQAVPKIGLTPDDLPEDRAKLYRLSGRVEELAEIVMLVYGECFMDLRDGVKGYHAVRAFEDDLD